MTTSRHVTLGSIKCGRTLLTMPPHIYKITDQMPWYEKEEFEKWYKKTHRTVAPVEIIGKPEQIGIKKKLKKH